MVSVPNFVASAIVTILTIPYGNPIWYPSVVTDDDCVFLGCDAVLVDFSDATAICGGCARAITFIRPERSVPYETVGITFDVSLVKINSRYSPPTSYPPEAKQNPHRCMDRQSWSISYRAFGFG